MKSFGGLPDNIDERDYPYEAFAGYGVLDYPDRYDVEDKYPISQKDQGATLACGAFAVAYYEEVLNRVETGALKEFSPRSIYAFTHLTGGGSITRDAIMRLVNWGISPDSDFTSFPITEEHLQDATGFKEATARPYKARLGVTITDRDNFDLFCQVIYQNYGLVSGVNLSSQGWYSSPIRPPKDGEKIVGHIMYMKGYDVRDPDPAKHYIIAKDSFPSGDKKLYRNYWEANMVHSAWTLVDL